VVLCRFDRSACWHLCVDTDSDALLAIDVSLNGIHVIPLSGSGGGGSGGDRGTTPAPAPAPRQTLCLDSETLLAPNGIVISPEGVLFVADSGSQRIVSITVPHAVVL
jgi:hypothetical protein